VSDDSLSPLDLNVLALIIRVKVPVVRLMEKKGIPCQLVDIRGISRIIVNVRCHSRQ